jgi:uncharacterized protein YjbI with pentapeptide repeats
MANQEQLDLLRQGVEAWNQWRENNPDVEVSLSKADLSRTDLSSVNLSKANLNSTKLFAANLSKADFNGANLSRTNLNFAIFSGAHLNGANLSDASLYGTNLNGAILHRTNLNGAILNRANLIDANLSNANLSDANLSDANLSNANLNGAILSNAEFNGAILNGANLVCADLSAALVLDTNLSGAILTGACIEDWHINSHTNLQGVICEYIFNKYDHEKGQFTDRRPHDPNQIFAPGEFTKRYQIVLETVDLFFNDGIDWKAFLASLQDLKIQYGDDLNIQGIEKKAGGSFLVRVEVPSDTDKGIFERTAKELYETKLQTLEAYYEERLQLKGEQLSFFKEQVEIERIRNTRLERIVETMAEKESSKYDLRGAKFGGGFAAEGGTQTGGTFNDFSQNINELSSLIQSLRSRAESFPEAQKTEAIDHLTDLETDIQQPPEKRRPHRIKATLLALATIAAGVSGAVTNTNEFVGQLQELADKLNIPLPIEQVEPESKKQDAIDVKAIDSNEP